MKILKWDGVPRDEKLLVDYAHAEDNPLNRAIGKLLLIAMARRILQPGCKYDYMVILQGPEGRLKSSFFKELAGEDFFEESLTFGADAKKIMENTAGKWLAEIAELSGLNAKDIEHIKALITRTEDWARLAYGYFAESAPRQFVLVGTTNDEVFLRDAPGNRRYLPVGVTDIDIEALRRDREQLFAEAVELEKTYGPLIIPRELEADLNKRRQAVTNIDGSCERLSDYLSEKLSANPDQVFPKDDLYQVMGVDIASGRRPTSKHGKMLAQVTRKFSLRETKRTMNGKRIRVFVRQETTEAGGG